MIGRDQVSGLILAGGAGRRMQASRSSVGPRLEKPLIPLHGRPLIAWARDALPQGLAHCYVSANTCAEAYAAYGTVVADDASLGPGWGPLAGVASTLMRIRTPWLLVVPGDVPDPPCHLGQGLLQYSEASGALLAYVCSLRPQPLFMLVHVSLLANLRQYLLSGGRQAFQWVDSLGHAVRVPGDESTFFNINTQEDICLAHQLIPPPPA